MKPQLTFIAAVAFAQSTSACLEHLLEQRAASPSSVIGRRAVAPRSKTAIHNVRVFDGQTVGKPQTVIIDGEFISTDPSGVQTTVDARGRILIPGLVDAHVHISDVGGLEELASYGVTTAIVMACRNYTACAPLRGLDGVASFVSAGVPAVGPGSQHSKTFNLSSSQLISPSDDPTTVVSYTFGNNSDFYKITAEPDGPSQDMQNSLVQAVHKLGKQSMTHAADADAWQQAVFSGTDGIQHIATNAALSSDLLARALKNGQFSTPTMNIAKYAFSNPAILQFMGRNTSSNDSYDMVRQNVRAVHQAGIPILAGTDAVGTISTSISIPWGLTLHYELQNLVDAGLTPVEALRAATSIPAKYHRLADRGVIAPGKRADLVLLNSDPLANISNTLDIARVWVGGIEYVHVANGSAVNPSAPGTQGGRHGSAASLVRCLTIAQAVILMLGFISITSLL